jgi:hypothetical protein
MRFIKYAVLVGNNKKNLRKTFLSQFIFLFLFGQSVYLSFRKYFSGSMIEQHFVIINEGLTYRILSRNHISDSHRSFENACFNVVG